LKITDVCCILITDEQILKENPRLTREGILAAVRFGGEALRADVAYPVEVDHVK
jgi:hypothetical protein